MRKSVAPVFFTRTLGTAVPQTVGLGIVYICPLSTLSFGHRTFSVEMEKSFLFHFLPVKGYGRKTFHGCLRGEKDNSVDKTNN